MSGGGEKFVMTSLDEVRFGDPPAPPQAPFSADAPDLSGLGDLLNLSRQEVLDALFDAAIDSFDLALPDASFDGPADFVLETRPEGTASFGAPDQPRLPAGQPGGGEWTSGGGGEPAGADRAARRAAGDARRARAAARQEAAEARYREKAAEVRAKVDPAHAAVVLDAVTQLLPKYFRRGRFGGADSDSVPEGALLGELDRRGLLDARRVYPAKVHQLLARMVFLGDLVRVEEGTGDVLGSRKHVSYALPRRKADAPFYSPDQPRLPAGQPGGGEWTSGGGGDASVRPAALEDYARAVEIWKQDRALWTFTPNFGFQNVHFAWDRGGRLAGWVGWDVSPAGALNFAIDTRRDVRSPALAGRLLRAFLSSPDRARVEFIEAVAVTDAGQRMVESLAKRLGVPWTGERRTESATAGGRPAVAPAEPPERVPGRLAALAGRLRGFFGGGEAQFSWDGWATEDGPAGAAAFALAVDVPFYSPDQPRVPAGQPGGGRWAGGISPGTTAARDAASDAVRAFARGQGPASVRDIHALAGHLAKLTVAQIHALKAQHGLKGSAPNKAALVAKLAQRFRAHRAANQVAERPAPAPAPNVPAPPPSATPADVLSAGLPEKGDVRRVEVLRRLAAAHPGISDEALATLYASDAVYDVATPPANRKTHYGQGERREAALRFLIPQMRRAESAGAPAPPAPPPAPAAPAQAAVSRGTLATPAEAAAFAGALREAVTSVAGKGSVASWCDDVALAVKHMFPSAENWQGEYMGPKGPEPHTVAKVGPYWIDVTADQFGGKDVQALTSLDPAVYRGFARAPWPGSGKLDPAEDPRAARLAAALALATTQAAPPPPAPPPAPAIPDGPALEAGKLTQLTGVGGSVPVYRVDAGGRAYFVKQARGGPAGEPNPFLGNETAVADLARVAGVDAPAVRAVTFRGREALAAEWLPGKAVIDTPGGKAAVAALPPAEVARHLLFAFLADVDDRHLGNYVLSGGKLYSIDHELAFESPDAETSARGLAGGELFDAVGGPSGKTPGRGYHYPVPAAVARDMAAVAPRMAEALRARGMAAQADDVAARGRVLASLARDPSPTVGGLLRRLGWHMKEGYFP